jgi:hypothetical protein
MKLEETIISVTEQHVRELRSWIANPEDLENHRKVEIPDAASRIWALTELAHLVDSGLSKDGIKRLQALESECNALLRTLGWVSGRP